MNVVGNLNVHKGKLHVNVDNLKFTKVCKVRICRTLCLASHHNFVTE